MNKGNAFLSCVEALKFYQEPCPCEDCRCHMNYDQDLNCAKYAAEIHGELTFREIGERLGISAPRAKQNEGTALAKLVRRRRVLFDE